jgi:hypothetical protein
LHQRAAVQALDCSSRSSQSSRAVAANSLQPPRVDPLVRSLPPNVYRSQRRPQRRHAGPRPRQE